MKLLARAPAPDAAPRALAVVTPPAAPARRMFATAPEPLGTLLRLSVLAFAAGGWVGMEVARLAVTLTVWMLAPLLRRRRDAVRSGAGEVTAMLVEGRDGFADLARRSVARRRRRALPP